MNEKELRRQFGGARFNAVTNGPSPCAAAPWRAAQSDLKSSRPRSTKPFAAVWALAAPTNLGDNHKPARTQTVRQVTRLRIPCAWFHHPTTLREVDILDTLLLQ